MTTYRVTWGGVKQRQPVKTFCTECQKTLKRVVEESYYNNGFHNAQDTSRKNWRIVAARAKVLELEGTICQACADELDDRLICKKTTRTTKSDCIIYEVFQRTGKGNPPKLIGTISKNPNGGKYCWHRTKGDTRCAHHWMESLAEELRKGERKPQREILGHSDFNPIFFRDLLLRMLAEDGWGVAVREPDLLKRYNEKTFSFNKTTAKRTSKALNDLVKLGVVGQSLQPQNEWKRVVWAIDPSKVEETSNQQQELQHA
jgi:hypothetical protein